MSYTDCSLAELKEIGFAHGQSLVRHNIRDVPVCEDENEFMDKLNEICWEADDGYRQYSPFEFFAHDLNQREDSDEAWDAYEEGIGRGVAVEGELMWNLQVIE